jgi:hypothetical protein
MPWEAIMLAISIPAAALGGYVAVFAWVHRQHHQASREDGLLKSDDD